jgi:hypothetical protein
MSISRNVNELKIEKKNTCDPSIDRRVRLKIWVIDHPFDILGVDLYGQIGDTENPYSNGTERTKETI